MKQRVVVLHPVKRGGAENTIEAIAERKGDQIGRHTTNEILEVWRKILLRVSHHVKRKIEPNHSAAWKILKQETREFAGAAAGVEHTLVSTQLKLIEDALPPLELRRGEAMVF